MPKKIKTKKLRKQLKSRAIKKRPPTTYEAKDIYVLEGLEPVRRRPGMYIGSTGPEGLHHLVYEVVYNSIDEAIMGYCHEIKVTLLPRNQVKVEDDGRGIPVERHPQTKKSALETVMTTLHAGAKFGGKIYACTGGLHGVGVSAVCALSNYLKVEVCRNDVLALKAADIGIAMGIKGTDAAKEAADVVLADDNFVTISEGIFEGRKFFDNLKKGVKYYLSCKTALILIFLLPAILNIPFPFAPIQIIVLELFMDLAASAGFVAEPAEKTIYKRQPRRSKEKFLNLQMVRGIFLSGFSLFLAVTISYFYARWQNLSLIQTQTFAFSAWLIGHIILAFVSRSAKESLFSLGFFSNKIINLWAITVFTFLFLTIWVRPLGFYFKLSPPTLSQLGLIFLISFLTIFWQEFRKTLSFREI